MADRLEDNPSVNFLTPALCIFYLVFASSESIYCVIVVLETTLDCAHLTLH